MTGSRRQVQLLLMRQVMRCLAWALQAGESSWCSCSLRGTQLPLPEGFLRLARLLGATALPLMRCQ